MSSYCLIDAAEDENILSSKPGLDPFYYILICSYVSKWFKYNPII